VIERYEIKKWLGAAFLLLRFLWLFKENDGAVKAKLQQ